MQDSQEKERVRNKKRLINQNKKLNTEIKKLEIEINDVIGVQKDIRSLDKNMSNSDGHYNNNSQESKKLREELTIQQGYLKKLKNKVDFLKATDVKGNAQYITKEEDDLKILKKDYQILLEQKQTVIKFKKDKLKHLQRNQPFQEHKKQIQNSLAQVRLQNRKMQADITELERQIRKYHNIQTMSKIIERDKADAKNTDVEYELAKAKHQLIEIRKKVKDVEEKWKPQFQSLDKEYFQLKNQYKTKQSMCNQIEKEHRMWETRKSSLRQEEEVLEYRNRLSKIHTTEWKLPQPTKIKRKSRDLSLLLNKANKNKKSADDSEQKDDSIQKKTDEQDGTNKYSQVQLPSGLQLSNKDKNKKAVKFESQNTEKLARSRSQLPKSSKNKDNKKKQPDNKQISKNKETPPNKTKGKDNKSPENQKNSNKKGNKNSLSQTKIQQQKISNKNTKNTATIATTSRKQAKLQKGVDKSPKNSQQLKNDKSVANAKELKNDKPPKNKNEKTMGAKSEKKLNIKEEESTQKANKSPSKKDASKDNKKNINQEKSQKKQTNDKKTVKKILKSVGIGTM